MYCYHNVSTEYIFNLIFLYCSEILQNKKLTRKRTNAGNVWRRKTFSIILLLVVGIIFVINNIQKLYEDAIQYGSNHYKSTNIYTMIK